jgi:isoleucyl-tRNA synthetase
MNEAKSTHAEREERILEYWKQDGTFQKSLEKDSPKGDFVFYDGPPFATGTPHYGHLLTGTIKDVIPRYKTMQGYHVPRRWGWDCHGLPLENLIEKELGLKTKKDIEELGIENFNDAARNAVLRYAHIWKEVVPRFGRWVDMDNDYRTMDSSYTESVWWAFKTLHDKGLVYEGYKSMQLCPRCGTTLSNFEVNQGYKDITDISVYVKFKIEPNTFLLAWTTTPWTLPGNAALAVGPDITYAKIKIGDDFYILAKERLVVIKDAYTVEKEMLGKDLVGAKYTPVFDAYIKEGKVYPAEFVTTTDGTGIVHIAPAFGQDDYDLGKKYDLKFIQHVTPDGKMTVVPFEGMDAKPKDDHQRTDVEVIKYLAGKGTLFAKEKLIHSYPHCWRCDTPLLNYASSSWFVKVPEIKNKLVSENKKVHWVPESVGANRFGNWLEGARDWAISRSRYWGAPLPVWKSKTETKIIASLSDIQKACKPRNNILLMRHGEIESNKNNLISADIHKKEGLTENGKKQVKKSAESLKNKKIDLVFISPFFRTKETAKIVAGVLDLKSEHIKEDVRLAEVDAMDFQGRPWSDILNMYRDRKEWFDRKIVGLETLSEVRERVGSFVYEIDKKYKDKNILIISHNTPLKIVQALSEGKDDDCDIELFDNAEVRALHFTQLPRNREYKIDFHRPYIDEVVLHDSKGHEMKRVPEVFDCWFESGSMPFASQPVRPKWFGKIKGYPAQFIAEGLDQTRGWFYSMLVLGTALFGKSPYENVIVNGLVLAEDGKKMSKSLKNYPDPMDVVNKFGADAIRYFMLLSPAMAGEDLRFSEKGVDEVVKKVINRLDNVVTFFEMYSRSEAASVRSTNILDKWIMARLHETAHIVTEGMDKYELHIATRPFNDFIDDLSTWYLRRSRDRFKDGDVQAIQTTKYILTELSKLLAPFMPFFAEDMYQRLGNTESVHLASWPAPQSVDQKVIVEMKKTRDIVTFGLEARTRFSIKVRQPLAKLSVRELVSAEFVELIKDEVNVKTVVEDKEVKGEVLLDHVITPELKEEGDVREFLRLVQDLRKEKGLKLGEPAKLAVATDEKTKALIEKNKPLLLKVAQIKEVTFTLSDAGTTMTIER